MTQFAFRFRPFIPASIATRAPAPLATDLCVVSEPILGGLHHDFRLKRKAAWQPSVVMAVHQAVYETLMTKR
jgi:hypothetical protein